ASSRDKKVTITSINEPYYVRRYIGAIRLPDNPTKISQEGITSITPN
ncbi:MAG TPA: peptidoglycan endopeptidase, partial [Nitrospiraceae bacterium]|nr:peptidoglycan endopeptidase [Nitrospiraceae bacterium]